MITDRDRGRRTVISTAARIALAAAFY